MARTQANPLAEQVYLRLKEDIFDFRLLPGDRFTETEMAERYEVSRTPLRDALYRLQREGYLDVEFRRGWQVRKLDFAYFDHLYDLRIILETASIQRICASTEWAPALLELKGIWLVTKDQRHQDGARVAHLDEQFHALIVDASGNAEMSRVHADITEKIRIIRRLDFTRDNRIEATYKEHGKILRLLFQRDAATAGALLRGHIELSKQEVRQITLAKLQQVQS